MNLLSYSPRRSGRPRILDALAVRDYRRPFTAQVIALLGSGLLTVGLALKAFALAGDEAGAVLATALTIKMVAYVVVAPVIAALTAGIAPKAVLVGADLVRAATALSLPWVTDLWQVYALVFALQAAAATFVPALQAVIPAILPDEGVYTRALSLSRLAYDLEALLSPALAAALLSVSSHGGLFIATGACFGASLLLICRSRMPGPRRARAAPMRGRLVGGLRAFVSVPELRGLAALNLAVAAGSSMVIVNSVVYVRGVLARPESDLALLLGAAGAGSMIAALAAPALVDRAGDRAVMLAGAAALPVGLLAAAGVLSAPAGAWLWALPVWAGIGAGASLVLTPAGRLLRRASGEGDRAAVFTAQFSLSHACFMATYPLAGLVGAGAGLPATALVLAAIALGATLLSGAVWPAAPGPRPAREDRLRA